MNAILLLPGHSVITSSDLSDNSSYYFTCLSSLSTFHTDRFFKVLFLFPFHYTLNERNLQAVLHIMQIRIL